MGLAERHRAHDSLGDLDRFWLSLCTQSSQLLAGQHAGFIKRSTFARITTSGLETIAAAAPQHVDSVRRHLLDHLSPAETSQLGHLLEKLVTERG